MSLVDMMRTNNGIVCFLAQSVAQFVQSDVRCNCNKSTVKNMHTTVNIDLASWLASQLTERLTMDGVNAS
jgi:hypothetical protein